MTSALRRYSGIALLILAQVLWYLRQDTPLFGAILAAPGLALLLLSPANSLLPDTKSAVPPNQTPVQMRFGLLRIGALALGVGLTVLISWLGVAWQQDSPANSAWLILVLWLLSALLVFLALVGVPAIRNWIGKVRDSLFQSWREWLTVFVLTLAGLALRLIWLDRLPRLMGEDEARFALRAVQLAAGWHGSPLRYDEILNQPMIYHLAQAVSISLFGQTVAAARFPSAFVGTLAIPGVYLAARRMFSPRLALIASALLVTLTIDVHFSRLALSNIIDPTIAIWTFAFLVGALRTGDPVEYGLVGLLLGLSQYGYSSGRLLPIIVAIYLGLVLVHHRLAWKRLLVSLTLGLVLFCPFAYWLAAEHFPLNPRLRDIAAWLPVASLRGLPADSSQYLGYWTQQVTHSIFTYVQTKDSGLYFGQLVPFLGWIAPVFLLIGLAIMLKGWRNPDRLILVIWIAAATLLGSVLTTEPPQYQRLLIVIPALVILIAAGLVGAVNALIPFVPRLSERYRQDVIRLVPLIIVLILIETDLKTYLVDYSNTDPYFKDIRTQTMNYLDSNALPELQGYQIWYLPTWWFDLGITPIVKYQLPWVHSVELDGSPEEMIATLKKTSGKQAIFIAVDHPNSGEFYSKLLTLAPVQTTELVPLPNHVFAIVLVRLNIGQ